MSSEAEVTFKPPLSSSAAFDTATKRVVGGVGMSESKSPNEKVLSASKGESVGEASFGRSERDPFAVTPQLRARSNASIGYVGRLTGGGIGDVPPMVFKGMMAGPNGRIALIEIKDIGFVRVKERDTFQVSAGLAFRVKRIRHESVELESGHADTAVILVR